jgi:hypothetical protein
LRIEQGTTSIQDEEGQILAELVRLNKRLEALEKQLLSGSNQSYSQFN